MIYVVRAGKTGMVKIGKTRNMAKRLNSLACGSPHKLRVLVTADWPDEAEHRLHAILAETRRHGEWFVMDDYLQTIIELMKEGKDSYSKLLQFDVADRKPPKRLVHIFALSSPTVVIG